MSFEGFLRRLLSYRPNRDSEPDGGDEPDDREPDDDDGDDGAAQPSERVYLEFVEGSSAKFYALVIVRDDDGTWGVAFNFGRIGYPREWGRKITGASRAKAQDVLDATRDEKLRGGYGERLWPDDLTLPQGAPGSTSGASGHDSGPGPGIYVATTIGLLPPASGGSVAGVSLPAGRLLTIEAMTGPADGRTVMWMSNQPLDGIAQTWARLAEAFAQTGLWPLIVDDEGSAAMDERLSSYALTTSRGAAQILSEGWDESMPSDEEEFDADAYAPLGKRFPGLAPATPGERPTTIAHLLGEVTGYLGLVAVERPADVPGAIWWQGPANYDLHPADQTTILRSWEDRFDAYLVGLGADTMELAVARPPLGRASAVRIAAEHMAFCPDNIWQGVGSVREYADDILRAEQWAFWWD
ncbi:MAG: DUF4253 domain-containing protein [Chloroflexi bacterium]|nr:DUF4253 domain-containing protein [Chloroflexota bacterium]